MFLIVVCLFNIEAASIGRAEFFEPDIFIFPDKIFFPSIISFCILI
tara:strand:+ start:245 stop:382 length:138 start_codon:yes stop_codon:yes gene_type:complete